MRDSVEAKVAVESALSEARAELREQMRITGEAVAEKETYQHERDLLHDDAVNARRDLSEARELLAIVGMGVGVIGEGPHQPLNLPGLHCGEHFHLDTERSSRSVRDALAMVVMTRGLRVPFPTPIVALTVARDALKSKGLLMTEARDA